MNDYPSIKNEVIFDYKNEKIYIKNPERKIERYSDCYEIERMFFSQTLVNIKYFQLNVEKFNLQVIALEENDCSWHFLINNWYAYSKLLSYFQDSVEELVQSFGTQKAKSLEEAKYFFYCHCFAMSICKMGSVRASLDDKLYLNIKTYGKGDLIYLHHIDFTELFITIKDFLPENIVKAKKQKEQEEQQQLIASIILKKNEIDNQIQLSSDEYIKYLSNIKLKIELKEINEKIIYWQKAKELNAVESDWIEDRVAFLHERILLINQKYEQKLRQEMLDIYGSIEYMKMNLLKIIKDMPFNEALNLHFHYIELNKELLEKHQKCVFKMGAEPYLLYADFFKHASVYISNYLNTINKMKSKKKVIPQKQINDALMYLYCVDSVEEALDLQAQKDYLDNRSSGSKGEAEVEYALKWLVGNYIKIEPVECGKYGEKAIVLNNKDFIDEPQEFDHIVISKYGIFNIETKNYAGKLIIDKNGNWIRIKQDGNEVGERNPIQQVRRHEIMLRSIVGENVPIINILVMANPKMIIEGVENCSMPLLKSDRLEEFISNYQSEKVISDVEMKNIQSNIEKHRAMK